MIAKGNTHAHGAKLASYMVTGKAGERAELYQLRGFATGDIRAAFRDVQLMAGGTHCDKPFFHVQVRNPDGDELTREQWIKVADRIESKLRYTGQPRAIAFHTDEKTGHEHMHLAFSRIDQDSLTALPLPYFKLRLKEVCRELEGTFDLTPVSDFPARPEIRSPERAEHEQSRRLETDIHVLRATIRDAYDQADSGKAFAAALTQQGMTLCQGERRDFVVIDAAGGLHALGKRVLGTTAGETRARLADLAAEALPTVVEARAHLNPRPERQAKPTPPAAQPSLEDERAARIERFNREIQARRADPKHRYHALHATHRQVAEQLGQAGPPASSPAKDKADDELLAEIRRQMERARNRDRER